MDRTYSQWMKATFHTNDYYNCTVYSAASGVVSSQKGLKKLYMKKKRGMKESIRKYIRTGGWKKPYLKCVIRPAGKSGCLPGGKKIPISEYERAAKKM